MELKDRQGFIQIMGCFGSVRTNTWQTQTQGPRPRDPDTDTSTGIIVFSSTYFPPPTSSCLLLAPSLCGTLPVPGAFNERIFHLSAGRCEV